MTSCAVPPPGAPVVHLTLVGTGEPLLRMEKRLACAAAGAGVALQLHIRKNSEMLGIPFEKTPAVLMNGQMVMSGLPRTEDIEAWLARFVVAGMDAKKGTP